MVFLLNLILETGTGTETAIDCNIEPRTTEGRLKKRLFCNYDRNSRPSAGTGPTVLKVKLIVKGFNFEDLENKLTVSSWLAIVTVKIDYLLFKNLEFSHLSRVGLTKT